MILVWCPQRLGGFSGYGVFTCGGEISHLPVGYPQTHIVRVDAQALWCVIRALYQRFFLGLDFVFRSSFS